MATEKTNPTLTESTEAERSEAHAATRRKLLKAGIAGAPVIITLRSGTAWAVSSCIDRLDAPYSKEHANQVIDAGSTNIAQYLGAPSEEQLNYVKSMDLGAWPPEGEKELYYLAAYAPSCYQSFCDSAGPTAGNCIM